MKKKRKNFARVLFVAISYSGNLSGADSKILQHPHIEKLFLLGLGPALSFCSKENKLSRIPGFGLRIHVLKLWWRGERFILKNISKKCRHEGPYLGGL